MFCSQYSGSNHGGWKHLVPFWKVAYRILEMCNPVHCGVLLCLPYTALGEMGTSIQTHTMAKGAKSHFPYLHGEGVTRVFQQLAEIVVRFTVLIAESCREWGKISSRRWSGEVSCGPGHPLPVGSVRFSSSGRDKHNWKCVNLALVNRSICILAIFFFRSRLPPCLHCITAQLQQLSCSQWNQSWVSHLRRYCLTLCCNGSYS